MLLLWADHSSGVRFCHAWIVGTIRSHSWAACHRKSLDLTSWSRWIYLKFTHTMVIWGSDHLVSLTRFIDDLWQKWPFLSLASLWFDQAVIATRAVSYVWLFYSMLACDALCFILEFQGLLWLLQWNVLRTNCMYCCIWRDQVACFALTHLWEVVAVEFLGVWAIKLAGFVHLGLYWCAWVWLVADHFLERFFQALFHSRGHFCFFRLIDETWRCLAFFLLRVAQLDKLLEFPLSRVQAFVSNSHLSEALIILRHGHLGRRFLALLHDLVLEQIHLGWLLSLAKRTLLLFYLVEVVHNESSFTRRLLNTTARSITTKLDAPDRWVALRLHPLTLLRPYVLVFSTILHSSLIMRLFWRTRTFSLHSYPLCQILQSFLPCSCLLLSDTQCCHVLLLQLGKRLLWDASKWHINNFIISASFWRARARSLLLLTRIPCLLVSYEGFVLQNFLLTLIEMFDVLINSLWRVNFERRKRGTIMAFSDWLKILLRQLIESHPVLISVLFHNRGCRATDFAASLVCLLIKILVELFGQELAWLKRRDNRYNWRRCCFLLFRRINRLSYCERCHHARLFFNLLAVPLLIKNALALTNDLPRQVRVDIAI